MPTNKNNRYLLLCLNEKLFIIEHHGNNLLNQRNKLISKCRHKNKFKLMNYKTWPLCGKCPCSELFSGVNFSCIWAEYGNLQIKSLCIHSECGITWARAAPNATIFYAVDIWTLLRYFNIIVFCIVNLQL